MLRRFCARSVALCLMMVLLVGLTGCMIIPIRQKIELRYDVSEIAAIEIFNLGDGAYDVYQLEELMEQNFIPVATLESEQYSGFAEEIKELDFSDTLVIAPASVSTDYSFIGYIVKITYANGEYEILNHRCQAYHNDKGNYPDSYGCDEGEWNRLIETYLPADTPIKPAPAPVE